jgi:hypothetical protein
VFYLWPKFDFLHAFGTVGGRFGKIFVLCCRGQAILRGAAAALAGCFG